jgi:hypothetical protein
VATLQKIGSLGLLFQTGFCLELTHQFHIATSVEKFLVVKGIKTISHPSYSLNHPSELFTLSKREVRASWPLAVAGQLQDELGRGHADHH